MLLVDHCWKSVCVNCHSSVGKIILNFCLWLPVVSILFLQHQNLIITAYLQVMELLILTDVSRIFYSEVLRISDFYKSFFNSQSLLSFNTFLRVSLRLCQRNDKAEDTNMPSKKSTPFFNKMVMQFQRIYPLDFRY